MTLGQLFGGRLSCSVDDSKIKMRIRVIGIIGNGFKHFFFGRFLPALLTRSNPQVIVSGGALRVNRERPGQLGEGIIIFGLSIVNDPEGRA